MSVVGWAKLNFSLPVGMLAKFAGIEAFDLLKICMNITRREHCWSDSDNLFGIIDIAQGDRHGGSQGDVVKTCFPIRHIVTRAFGRYCNHQFPVLVERIYNLLDEAVASSTVYGYSTQLAQDTPQGPLEKSVFSDPV